MKLCSKCRETKPREQFNRSSRARDGLQSYCRACSRQANLAWIKANPERSQQAQKRYAEQHPERVRDSKLRCTYGISASEFDLMLERQEGLCALCRGAELTIQGWHIDHDHSCCPGRKSCGNCVRGILCASCNLGLGQFKDDVKRLRAAVEYLETKGRVQV